MLAFTVLTAVIASLYFYCGKSLTNMGSIADAYFLFSNNFVFETSMFLYVIPLISSMTAVDIKFDEVNLYPALFTKINENKFHIARMVSAIIQTFIIFFVFLEIIFVLMHIFVDVNNVYILAQTQLSRQAPILTGAPFLSLCLNHYIIYTQIYIFMISIYGALLSGVSYGISLFMSKKVYVYVATFFSSLFAAALFSFMGTQFENGLVVLYPQHLLNPFGPTSVNPGIFTIEFGLFLWGAILMLVSFILLIVHRKVDLR